MEQVGDSDQFAEISEDKLLSFLRDQLRTGDGLSPQVNLDVPLAHGYPPVESYFDINATESVELLEDLARRNVLDRALENRLHLCPECDWFTLNFVELCPSCKGLDIGIQEVIHHFSCAYVGAWSEFRDGSELICPKCDDQLRNIGMDYEKPSETYICNECEHIFTESLVRARCLRDGEDTAPEDLPLVSIYSYHTNSLTRRAIEVGRLEGIELDSLLFDENSRTIRREFLLFELNREIERTERYETDLSLIMLWFDGIERVDSRHDTTESSSVQDELLDDLAGSIRTLDLVCNLEQGLGALLLPETDVEGAIVVAKRSKEVIDQHPEVRRVDQFEVTVAVGTIHGEQIEDDAKSFIEFVHEHLLKAVREDPGSIITVERTSDA